MYSQRDSFAVLARKQEWKMHKWTPQVHGKTYFLQKSPIKTRLVPCEIKTAKVGVLPLSFCRMGGVQSGQVVLFHHGQRQYVKVIKGYLFSFLELPQRVWALTLIFTLRSQRLPGQAPVPAVSHNTAAAISPDEWAMCPLALIQLSLCMTHFTLRRETFQWAAARRAVVTALFVLV